MISKILLFWFSFSHEEEANFDPSSTFQHLVAMEGFTVEPLEETTATAATAATATPAEEKIGVEVEVSSIIRVFVHISTWNVAYPLVRSWWLITPKDTWIRKNISESSSPWFWKVISLKT